MIKLIEIHIEEFRGIKKLTLRPQSKNFVICGPNGSGKSGVVDAIDFAITGNVSRLAGTGTKSLSLKKHGPHVDARENLDTSLVRLVLEFPTLNKKATIERKLSSPKQCLVIPDDQDIKNVLKVLEEHSEITLSRREIIKYILSEGSTRSKNVQALLKLDDLDTLRKTLKTTANTLSQKENSAMIALTTTENELKRHFEIDDLNTKVILDIINIRRKLLNLSDFLELKKDTNINAGLIIQEETDTPFSRKTSLLDLSALQDFLSSEESSNCVNECIDQFDILGKDPNLLQELKQADLYEQGLGLLTEDACFCPLCDTKWEFNSLLTHIQNKLERANNAKTTRQNLSNAGQKLQSYLFRLIALLKNVVRIAHAVDQKNEALILDKWISELVAVHSKFSTIDGLLEEENTIRNMRQKDLSEITDAISKIHAEVFAKPDNTAELEARTFLVIAQERFQKYHIAQLQYEQERQASIAAQKALDSYNSIVQEMLGGLYSQIESELADYYRLINDDDEEQFTVKLEQEDAALNLEVDFYNRGLFPPSAFHSEGHQDSMGLCLYLALVKQLLQDNFTFVVLDDVVMSVDIQHRRQICELFKIKFPNTQFIITTHEQAWYIQMCNQGLVSKKSSVMFRNWTVQDGPLLAESPEIWDEIYDFLEKDDVSTAAFKLRRHLEYTAREIAEPLRAEVKFRGDGNYDLGDLFDPAMSRIKKYLKEAKNSARSWSDVNLENYSTTFLSNFEAKYQAAKTEQWAINPKVHYNEWANFTKEEFEIVVKAFQDLLNFIRCEKCNTWLYLIPQRGEPSALRCDCTQMNFNLVKNK